MNLKEPKVSIIIPIHNAEEFIETTIRALLKGLIKEAEVICIFDNCTDKSAQVVQELFIECDRVSDYRFKHSRNGSVAISRNEGIELASGEFVAFLDHDDIVDSNMYNRLLTFAKLSPLSHDVVRCGFSISKEGIEDEYIPILPSRKSYPFNGIFIWNGIYRLKFLNENKIRFTKGYGEDYEFNLSLLANKTRQGAVEKESVYYQWQHHDSNFHKERLPSDFIKRLNSMLDNYNKTINVDGEIKKAMFLWASGYLDYLLKTNKNEEQILKLATVYHESLLVKTFMNCELRSLISEPLLSIIRSSDAQEFTLLSRDYIKEKKRDKKKRRHNLYSSIKRPIKKILGKKSEYFFIPDIAQKYLNFLLSSDNPKVIFFVFKGAFISGGLISIYSIAEKLRANGYDPILVSDPEDSGITTAQNFQFPNNEITISWAAFIKHRNQIKDIKYVMVPEVKVASFSKVAQKFNIFYPDATLNILNQNIQLMPTVELIDSLKSRFKSTSMTTAHLRYSTQEVSNTYNLPLKHISTYLSFRNYDVTPHHEKAKRLLFSHDPNQLKGPILEKISKSLKGYEVKEILGFTYSDYIRHSRNSRFTLTFGEGLDNYFIEPFFSGGIGMCVYNPSFMPPKFLSLDNVFRSYPELLREVGDFLNAIESDCNYRSQIWKKNFNVLSEIYDDRIYDRKIQEYLDDCRDFFPEIANDRHSILH